MSTPYEATMTLYTAQLQAARRMFDAYVTGLERIDHVLMQAAKDVMHGEFETASAMCGVRTARARRVR